MDVSIIIVNYNTCEVTRNCLKSVFEQTKNIDFEVIVSDNGSKDGSVDMIKSEFPQVVLIENNANLGFGAANNKGLEIAKGKYILYLNSDTILLNNAVKIFFDYWEKSSEKEKIGALGANMLDKNHNITLSYGKFRTPICEIYLYIRKICFVIFKLICRFFRINYKKIQPVKKYTFVEGPVDFIGGADLFLLNNSAAKFDIRFFLYYEETYLQWNLKHNNLQRLLINGPEIIHLHGGSDNGQSDGDISDYTTFGAIQQDISRVKFYKYNFSKFSAFALKTLTILFWNLTSDFRKRTKKYLKELIEI